MPQMYGEEGFRQHQEAPRVRQAAEGPGLLGRASAAPGAAVGYDGGITEVQIGVDDSRYVARRLRRGESASSLSSDAYRRNPPGCFITAWAFCLVSVATLTVPVVFFLLPLIRASFFVATTHDPAFSTPATSLPPAPTLSTLSTTMKTVVVTPVTTNTSQGISQDCLKLSPGVPGAEDLTDIALIPDKKGLDPAPSSVDGGKNQPVYCIYNVTRFRRPAGYYFLPFHIPFALCPHIVYWSWCLPGGNLSSRAKNFDENYGLAVIKKAAQDQTETVDVLLTLGGYAEDSADFYRVQNDYKARQRLVHGVYKAYRLYELSGITLHWVPNDPCDPMHGGSVPRLGEFIENLQLLASLNVGASKFNVTAIVDTQDSIQMEFFRAHQSHLNLTFFTTHHLLPENNFDEYCEHSVPVFASQLARLRGFFPEPQPKGNTVPSEQRKGLCVSMSLALYARKGFRLEEPTPPQLVSRMPGYMALFEVCDSKLNFSDVLGAIPGCVFGKTSGSLLNVTFAFDDITTLRAKMAVLGNGTELCVLLYDVDWDNYRQQCRAGIGSRYLMLQHFYSARIDKSNFNVTHFVPRVTFPS
ncbi:hypothetical protein V5799_027505 [Amblyomma americanum]|uniref:Chitinase n=1 Tax=Amblyomma americanum TaxID=6943 RepID=A0AAQ4DFI8_AMBAM